MLPSCPPGLAAAARRVRRRCQMAAPAPTVLRPALLRSSCLGRPGLSRCYVFRSIDNFNSYVGSAGTNTECRAQCMFGRATALPRCLESGSCIDGRKNLHDPTFLFDPRPIFGVNFSVGCPLIHWKQVETPIHSMEPAPWHHSLFSTIPHRPILWRRAASN